MEKKVLNKTDFELTEKEERIQYLEKVLEEYSRELYENNIETLTAEEYQMIFNEYEMLINEETNKKNETTFWDEVSLWIVFYGIFQLIFCLPWFLYFQVGIKVMILFEKWFLSSGINRNIIDISALFLMPILNLMVSWIIFVNFVKKQNNKKLFIIVWIVQFILTLIGGIYVTWLIMS